MIKGIYSSSAGMQPRMTRMEVVANNLANIDTTGYKRDNVFFQMVKDNVAAGGKNGSQDAANDVQEQTDFSSGALKQTNNTLILPLPATHFLQSKHLTVFDIRAMAILILRWMERLLRIKGTRC